MRNREAEIKTVASRLDDLLDQLAAAVEALNAIMPPPEPSDEPEPPQEPEPPGADERLVER